MKRLFFSIVAIALIFTGCQKEFVITVKSNDTSLGKTGGSGTYLKGTEIEISAIPKSGCEFIKWEDGNTENPRLIAVGENKTYIAVFEKEKCFSLIVDGVEREITRGIISEYDIKNDDYYIWLCLKSDKPEFIDITGRRRFHDGQLIDLSQKEYEHKGLYWSIGYNVNYRPIFRADGYPYEESVSSGTLYMKYLADSVGQPFFEIRAENCIIESKDEQGNKVNHTIELNYKGVLQWVDEI